MQQIIEDIELDLKELKYLLEGVQRDPHLALVAKRRIQETIRRFELIRNELDVIGTSKIDETVELPEEMIALPEETEEIAEAEETEEAIELSEETIVVEEAVATAVLGEQLKPAVDLNKGLSLNDTFRFSRELFNGDTEKMNHTLQKISRMSSLAEVVSYLSSQIAWDEENEAIQDFNELLKKYFV